MVSDGLLCYTVPRNRVSAMTEHTKCPRLPKGIGGRGLFSKNAILNTYRTRKLTKMSLCDIMRMSMVLCLESKKACLVYCMH